MLKKLIKPILILFCILVMLIVAVLMGESYEIIEQTQNNRGITIEVKRVFGEKISEATINSEGFYHGKCINWYLLQKGVRAEGQYKNGFWHGKWKDYNRDGELKMIRVWKEGRLIKLFIPENGALNEVSIDQWPQYTSVQQTKPLKAKIDLAEGL